MVLPYLQSAFAAGAFEVFGKVANIHEHPTLGARLFFGVCLRDGTGLCGFFVGGLSFGE
jgi:hypothetical protein